MEKTASLYFKNGSSDKVYHAQLVNVDEGYIVNFQYGKRGSTLKSGTKTKEPVSLEKAVKVFDKLVKSKVSKGYSEGEEGVKYNSPQLNQEDSGESPQLLNEVKDEVVLSSLINDDNFLAQEKYDGERRMLKKTKAKTVGINKKGLVVALPVCISDSVEYNCVLDGEQVGNTLYVWDLLSLNGKSIKNKPYTERLEKLNSLSFGDNIIVVKTAMTEKEKETLIKTLQEQNKEGIVFKIKTHKYKSGRQSSGGDALKFKFYKTTTVKVADHTEGKRSVKLSMLDKSTIVSVGKVTIPPNKEIPQVGDYVEVRYLYAYKGGSLFQPVFLGKRNDQDDEDINISQLVYKSEI